MNAMISDAQFNSIALVIIAAITIIPTTLAAYWARGAKKDSGEAKENSAKALHEVATNGGMSDPNPNLNDHVKYQTQMLESLGAKFSDLRADFDAHLAHSKIMDEALAELYLEIRPTPREWPDSGKIR